MCESYTQKSPDISIEASIFKLTQSYLSSAITEFDNTIYVLLNTSFFYGASVSLSLFLSPILVVLCTLNHVTMKDEADTQKGTW